MKSQLADMLRIWEAVSFDAASVYATSSLEFARDRERARTSASTRGLGFFTLDLPSLDTFLTNLLERGEVHFEGPFTASRSRKDLRPRFLWALWSRVCDADGCLLSEPDADAIFFLRQLCCLYKKMEFPCSDSRLKKAVATYHENDRRIIPPVLDWTADHLPDSIAVSFVSSFAESDAPLLGGTSDSQYSDAGFLERLDRISRLLLSSVPHFDSMSEQERDFGEFRHGPGRVSNLRSSSSKYSFPYWSDKLEGVFPFDWCSGAGIGEAPRFNLESPSKLCAVPKTAKAPRLIASEPVEHQWCQQKVATFLSESFHNGLIGKFLNLRDQSLSQAMVASASLDGSYATIDLSNASDLLSCRHVEALLSTRKDLLDAVHASRTRILRDPFSGAFVKLRKFASQGSALTFPLESLFFLLVALASSGDGDYRAVKRLVGKVRVFGDDIIVPNYAYTAVVKNLEALGLQVNKNKSFSKGLFRESCGSDCWNGYDVTPVKPKSLRTDTLESRQALVDLSNNLHQKGCWKAAQACMEMLPKMYREHIFSFESGVPGLKSFVGTRTGKTSWCKHLHYDYVTIPSFVKRTIKVVQDSSAALREFFTRRFDGMNPRILGVAQGYQATFAWVRVPV